MTEDDHTFRAPGQRRIGGLLLIGVILLPIVFYWFLLRPGYSMTARLGAGIYLMLGLALTVMRALRP